MRLTQHTWRRLYSSAIYNFDFVYSIGGCKFPDGMWRSQSDSSTLPNPLTIFRRHQQVSRPTLRYNKQLVMKLVFLQEGYYSIQRTLTYYFLRGSITVQLTSFLTGLDSAALLILNKIQIYKFGWIQTSQTGGQLYSDTSPYEVSECFLLNQTT